MGLYSSSLLPVIFTCAMRRVYYPESWNPIVGAGTSKIRAQANMVALATSVQ